MPYVTGGYTFAIKSSQPNGRFETPDYGIGNYSSSFYTRFHHHQYQLDLSNLVSLVANGTLIVNIETQGEEEEWTFSSHNPFRLHEQKLNFSDASHFCKNMGGHLASIGCRSVQYGVLGFDILARFDVNDNDT